MKSQRVGPTEFEYRNMKFYVTHCPTDSNVEQYIEKLQKHDAKHVVRLCEATYSKEPLEKIGISVMDWQFDDGTTPPAEVVRNWLSLLKTCFLEDQNCCVAVHCKAGLGRAPVMVAIAFMEAGMKYEDAAELIRQKRPGALNWKQLKFLEQYRPKSRLRHVSNRQCLPIPPKCAIL